uniref:S phase cyclin A-associated protein in the endoplasmic reticulum n=1 Tax=Anthurium amnicola TaxID=1678845 RepID=A0A1D1YPV0_9ARAE
MENDGVDENDQGSGWLEVKKRHKSNSRLSMRYVSGRSSGKIYSNSAPHQEDVNPRLGQQPKHTRAGPTVIAHADASEVSRGLALDEANKREDCPDKVVVSQDAKCPSKGTELTSGTTDIAEVAKGDNLDEVPKIKWGDLDDFALTLNEHCGYSLGSSKIRCDDDILAGHESAVNADVLVLRTPAHSPLQKEWTIMTSHDAEQFPDGMLSSSAVEESLEENWKVANEIPFRNVSLLVPDAKVTRFGDASESPGEVHDKFTQPSQSDVSESPGKVHDKFTQPSQSDVSESPGKVHDKFTQPSQHENGEGLVPPTVSSGTCPSVPSEEVIMTALHWPEDKSDDAVVNISKISVLHKYTDKNTGISASLQDSVPHPNHASVPKDTSVAANQAQSGSQDVLAVMDDPGGFEQGESKERFRQRLWCFLFENLNRAVDELYLLCELECDMEQIEEAILVLDEAGSDFRDLKSRVEGFESTKRLSSQLTKDGMGMNVKTDHRRPHALSWEVRRMTTTPNRAEILSSSIEAFKRIQQERAGKHVMDDLEVLGGAQLSQQESDRHNDNLPGRNDTQLNHKNFPKKNDMPPNVRVLSTKSRKQTVVFAAGQRGTIGEISSTSDINSSRVIPKDCSKASSRLRKGENLEFASETMKQLPDKVSDDISVEKESKSLDMLKRHSLLPDKEKEKQNLAPWKSMAAWKEKRNWEDILRSPMRSSTRVSHSPGMGRKGMDRARGLHDKLMSPEKKKKTTLDMKREAEERHARAMRIRNQLENERVQRLQRTSEKLNRVNEWQTVRSLRLRERMHARHQRSESRHEAYLAQVARRAGDESSKVNEVRFITSLNEENKKLMLRQKLHDSEVRRAEKLQVIRTKQKEDMAREEAVLGRRKLLEAEKLQRIAETQRRKEEAKVRREEERKASSAAREAKAVEQLRRKEVRAKAQQEEAELLAQKLAERLRESEQRRKFYLEQIREKASMDFRDQSSPSLRRPLNKEGQGRSISNNNVEEYQTSSNLSISGPAVGLGDATLQQSIKRRIKKIRQRLMAMKYDFTESSVGAECAGIAYRSSMGAARAKVGRWLQDLQRFRQARKEGAASIGLIVGDMIKYLEGKEPELHACRQSGLIDFIASALPASHTSKPEACHVTRYLLRVLRVVLSVPANRSYFLSQNLLPPIIPVLSACLENYIKIAASLNLPGTIILLSNKTSTENADLIAEVLDGFLWTVTTILGHIHSDERQLQMQNGLIELVIAYQIIHRLRDLFALYDRPQLEGSPFPSSILLSLDLLTVLTSRCGTVSSIDWGSCLSKTLPDGREQGAFITKKPDTSVTEGINAVDYKSLDINQPSVSEPVAAPVDHSGQTDRGKELSPDIVSLLDTSNCRNHASDVSREMGNIGPVLMSSTINSDKSPSIVLEKHSKTSALMKNESNIVDFGGERCKTYESILQVNDENRKKVMLKQPVTYLISAISETGLVSLSSLLTAVLLQANNRLSSEQTSYTLPSNFEEVATGVLKVLNNVALLDINLLQNMLARPDLQMEFFHMMSFLLSHCNSKWKGANDQVGLLLLESLLLLGYFALFHPGNQAVLCWGKNPTILHKICDLPFVFFSDPELTPILAGTLVAACYGCEQNRGVVQQELSIEMLMSLLKSCRQELQHAQSDALLLDASTSDVPSPGIHTTVEHKKLQGDFPLRTTGRGPQVTFIKGLLPSSNLRISKAKNQRDGKQRMCDDWALKHNLPASGAAATFMLHTRLPSVLIDKAEVFFTAEIPIESE